MNDEETKIIACVKYGTFSQVMVYALCYDVNKN